MSPQMCEINESPLFLKLNPLAKTNDVGYSVCFYHLMIKMVFESFENIICLCFKLDLLNSSEIIIVYNFVAHFSCQSVYMSL